MIDLTQIQNLAVVLIIFWIALESAIDWLLIVGIYIISKIKNQDKPELYDIPDDVKRFWSISIGIIVGFIIVYWGDSSFAITSREWVNKLLTILIVAGGKDALNELFILPVRTGVKLLRQKVA